MSFVEFIKKSVINYFITVTATTVAIAVLGMNFDREAVFGYEAFFSPLIFGVIASVPSFVLYSRKELSFKQMLVRRILHFIVLEIFLLGFGFLAGLFHGFDVALSFGLSVFLVYLFTNLMSWMVDSKTAKELNKGLKRFQE